MGRESRLKGQRGGATVSFDLSRIQRKGVAAAVGVLSLIWFLVLQLVPPAILGAALTGS